MRSLVVYESIYGNTRAVAEAIAEGLGDGEAVVAPVGSASSEGFDLVVAGGPTHMHGMSSRMSRDNAVKEAREEGVETEPGAADHEGLRIWLRDQDGTGRLAAAFDTRIDKSPLLTGMAGKGIAKRLERAGFDVVAEPASYLVEDSEGPLAEGELDRARAWGQELARHAEAAVS